ncbi:vanadium-dependent haloperoxidase [Streptomyces sp. NPDC050704]|uniref:vanadium-dependent haloperoxidase n=1 Tax=Streptomyces sp. NPDC050704 TaxID=3157219 RepID=UPI00343394A9
MRNRRTGFGTRTVIAGLTCGLLMLAPASPHAAAEAERTGRATGAKPNSPAGPSVVIEWMRTAASTISAEARPTPPEALIWDAHVSTAVYNAVVGIEGRYTPYKWRARAPRTASSEAAAASAAHHLLSHYFPRAGLRLDAALAHSLARIPDGRPEDDGVAFGKRAAAHIIRLRHGDGLGASVGFPVRPRPGVWRPTPPGHEPFATAWVAKVRPMLLDSPDQFRPGQPPALTSTRYAKDLNELKAYGGRTSSLRTPEQTDIARFFATVDLQEALGDRAARHGLDTADTARLYAAANTTQADAVIAAWDAKLHYATWRPVTAIRLAHTDRNPMTRADRHWEPLLTTPAHPDYLSGHATMGGALMRTLTELFGTSRVDLHVTSRGSSAPRHYRYAHEYDRDVVNARVWGGIHTRTADRVGSTIGRQISAWALKRHFRPLP